MVSKEILDFQCKHIELFYCYCSAKKVLSDKYNDVFLHVNLHNFLCAHPFSNVSIS